MCHPQSNTVHTLPPLTPFQRSYRQLNEGKWFGWNFVMLLDIEPFYCTYIQHIYQLSFSIELKYSFICKNCLCFTFVWNGYLKMFIIVFLPFYYRMSGWMYCILLCIYIYITIVVWVSQTRCVNLGQMTCFSNGPPWDKLELPCIHSETKCHLSIGKHFKPSVNLQVLL